jgi:transposase-like protein
MDKGRYLVEAHLRDGRPVAELAAAHGVHPSCIYRPLARYRAEGDTGLIPPSRRPKTSPNALTVEHSRSATNRSCTTSAWEPDSNTSPSPCSSPTATSASSTTTAILRELELDPTRDYQPQTQGWSLR